MIRYRPLLVIVFAASGLTAALAQEVPQVERQDLMSEVGDNTKILGEMAKRERPYDAETAVEALNTIIEDVDEFVTLFPEGSETGHETRALPAIWEQKAEFDERALALQDAAMRAREAAPGGHEAFVPAFREFGKACGACHDDFRAKKD